MVQKEEKSKSQKELIVEYQNELYDLSDFIAKHPGGRNFLLGKFNKNIEKSFNDIGHSKAAEYLLRGYKVNKEIQSLEKLVDWNKAMIPQIAGLGDKYYEWVNLPVDRKLRLFENEWLEMLTKTPWYVPMIFWIPIILHCIIADISSIKQPFDQIRAFFAYYPFGIFLWTLFEYNFHRYIFHIDTRKNPQMKVFHFLFHGLHHKVPFDEFRLVFPPVPAALIATIIYQLLRLLHCCYIISYPKLLTASLITGYLIYDMTHYYIHHGRPEKGYFYNLKRYHHSHHFVNHDIGFGVSNTMWDDFFNTKIQLKKLKYFLKW